MPAYGFIRPYQATPSGQAPVILTVGDSILHGAIPVSDGAGGWTYRYEGSWRRYFYAACVAAGVTPTMVGGILNSVDGLALGIAGLAHTGINGAGTAGWVGSYWATNKSVWELQGTPTVILLCTGNNDSDSQAAGQKIGELMDLAIADYPAANVVVSNCTANLDTTRTTINAEIASQVATRAAAGKHIQLMDSYSKVPATRANMPDGLHLSADGYKLWGDLWITTVLPLFT